MGTQRDWEGRPTYVGGEGYSILNLVSEVENEKGNIANIFEGGVDDRSKKYREKEGG